MNQPARQPKFAIGNRILSDFYIRVLRFKLQVRSLHMVVTCHKNDRTQAIIAHPLKTFPGISSRILSCIAKRDATIKELGTFG